jgi:hypothetical protein
MPGTGILNVGGLAQINFMACASAGNCSAGGNYGDTFGCRENQQLFVVSEVNGTWGNVVAVPGTAALNVSGNAAVNSVSRAAAGNCSVGGTYWGAQNTQQVFVDSENYLMRLNGVRRRCTA